MADVGDTQHQFNAREHTSLSFMPLGNTVVIETELKTEVELSHEQGRGIEACFFMYTATGVTRSSSSRSLPHPSRGKAETTAEGSSSTSGKKRKREPKKENNKSKVKASELNFPPHRTDVVSVYDVLTRREGGECEVLLGRIDAVVLRGWHSLARKLARLHFLTNEVFPPNPVNPLTCWPGRTVQYFNEFNNEYIWPRHTWSSIRLMLHHIHLRGGVWDVDRR